MRAANILVFDEHIQSSSTPSYTNQSWNERLGGFDQLAIMAVVDDVTTPGSNFKVQIEHSADGRLWLNKSSTAEIGGSSAITPPASSQTPYFGYDAGTIPNLGFVRLRVDLGASASAHVRLYVTGRMFGGR